MTTQYSATQMRTGMKIPPSPSPKKGANQETSAGTDDVKADLLPDEVATCLPSPDIIVDTTMNGEVINLTSAEALEASDVMEGVNVMSSPQEGPSSPLTENLGAPESPLSSTPTPLPQHTAPTLTSALSNQTSTAPLFPTSSTLTPTPIIPYSPSRKTGLATIASVNRASTMKADVAFTGDSCVRRSQTTPLNPNPETIVESNFTINPAVPRLQISSSLESRNSFSLAHVHHHITSVPETACLVWQIRDFNTFRNAAKSAQIPPLISHPFGGGCTIRLWPIDSKTSHVSGIVDIPASKWSRDGVARFSVSVLGPERSLPGKDAGSKTNKKNRQSKKGEDNHRTQDTLLSTEGGVPESTTSVLQRQAVLTRKIEVRVERGQYRKESAEFKLTNDRSFPYSGSPRYAHLLDSSDGSLTIRVDMDYFPFDSSVFKPMNLSLTQRAHVQLVNQLAAKQATQPLTSSMTANSPRLASMLLNTSPRENTSLTSTSMWKTHSEAGGLVSDDYGTIGGPALGVEGYDGTFGVDRGTEDPLLASALLTNCTGGGSPVWGGGNQLSTAMNLPSPYQTMIQDLARFCRSEVTERVELRCHGRSIITARTLLMARSPKFRDMIHSTPSAYRQTTAISTPAYSAGAATTSGAVSTPRSKKSLFSTGASSSLTNGGWVNPHLVGGYLVVKDLSPAVLEQIVQYISTDMCDWIDGFTSSTEALLQSDMWSSASQQGSPRLSDSGSVLPVTTSSQTPSGGRLEASTAPYRPASAPAHPTSSATAASVSKGEEEVHLYGLRPTLNPVVDDDDDVSRVDDDASSKKGNRGSSSRATQGGNEAAKVVDKWSSTGAEGELMPSSAQDAQSHVSRRPWSSKTATSNNQLAIPLSAQPPTSFGNSIALFTAADEYGIKGLVALAGDVLEKYHLKRDSVIEVWDVAQSCSYEPLKQACVEYMNRIPGAEVLSMLRQGQS